MEAAHFPIKQPDPDPEVHGEYASDSCRRRGTQEDDVRDSHQAATFFLCKRLCSRRVTISR